MAAGKHAACPFSKGQDAEDVKFTWWGGLLGPKVFSLVKCVECGRSFNGKTGGDPTVGIVIYNVVAVVVVAVAVALIWSSR